MKLQNAVLSAEFASRGASSGDKECFCRCKNARTAKAAKVESAVEETNQKLRRARIQNNIEPPRKNFINWILRANRLFRFRMPKIAKPQSNLRTHQEFLPQKISAAVLPELAFAAKCARIRRGAILIFAASAPPPPQKQFSPATARKRCAAAQMRAIEKIPVFKAAHKAFVKTPPHTASADNLRICSTSNIKYSSNIPAKRACRRQQTKHTSPLAKLAFSPDVYCRCAAVASLKYWPAGR